MIHSLCPEVTKNSSVEFIEERFIIRYLYYTIVSKIIGIINVEDSVVQYLEFILELMKGERYNYSVHMVCERDARDPLLIMFPFQGESDLSHGVQLFPGFLIRLLRMYANGLFCYYRFSCKLNDGMY